MSGKRINISLAISIVALVFSAWSFYYQSLRGARPLTFLAKVLYVTELRRIGVPAALYNAGTATAVIKNASLELSTAGQTKSLKLKWVSPFENTMLLKDNKWTAVEPAYTGFTVLLLKPGDTDSRVWWFEPDPKEIFALAATHYRVCAKFFSVDNHLIPAAERAESPTGELCSVSFEFSLTSSQVDLMKEHSTQNTIIDLR